MTRKLIVTENITLDGVIENDGSWFDPTEDSEQGRQLAEITRQHAARSDGFLVGRVTFEEMRGFWPTRVDDETGRHEPPEPSREVRGVGEHRRSRLGRHHRAPWG